ncbi:hypothetical protein LINPERHAP1_LOCUS18085, partial [Linum perenne]
KIVSGSLSETTSQFLAVLKASIALFSRDLWKKHPHQPLLKVYSFAAFQLQHMEQQVVPSVDWSRQAPMYTVIVECHICIREVPISARMTVWPQKHCLCRVHQPELEAYLPPFPLSFPVLFHLCHVQLIVN